MYKTTHLRISPVTRRRPHLRIRDRSVLWVRWGLISRWVSVGQDWSGSLTFSRWCLWLRLLCWLCLWGVNVRFNVWFYFVALHHLSAYEVFLYPTLDFRETLTEALTSVVEPLCVSARCFLQLHISGELLGTEVHAGRLGFPRRCVWSGAGTWAEICSVGRQRINWTRPLTVNSPRSRFMILLLFTDVSVMSSRRPVNQSVNEPSEPQC